MGCGMCQKCTNTTCVYAMPTDDMRRPTCMHNISFNKVYKPTCHISMQYAGMQYVNTKMQYASQHAVCQCKYSMQYAGMAICQHAVCQCKHAICQLACSMSTYSMQWLNMCLPTYAVCRRVRCQCTAFTYRRRNISLSGGEAPQPPFIHDNCFDLIKKNCTKPLQIYHGLQAI